MVINSEIMPLTCPKCGSTVKEFKNPVPTVDIIIQTPTGIILIERKNPPYGWAIPGGFVDYGESLEEAAIREAKEETNLDIILIEQLKTYSDPARDKRQHTISTVFIAEATGIPTAGDDAKQARIHQQDNLPKLAFDHRQILTDYFQYIEKTRK